MMRSHHPGSGFVLLAVFLAGMIATAQGQPEPTLALLAAEHVLSSSVVYPNSPRSMSSVLTVISPVWIARSFVRQRNGSASSRWNSSQWRSASWASPCWMGRST